MKKYLCIVFLFICPCLISYEIVEDLNTLPKVISSSAKTRKIKLDNEIEVYLISDPRAKKSAAILSVNAGSWQDPSKHPGLAHFLEHMLFMGTEKYPDEESFSQFIKSHGGETNAFTEDQHTSYVFDVETTAFPEALDRFSQFFISPLFKPSGLKREVQAVEQEFAGKSQQNIARRLMIYKSFGYENHPFNRFNFGNADSLKDAGQQELKKWFAEHYSANLMSLVIYSPMPLIELTSLINENFSLIEDRQIQKETFEMPLFSLDLKGKALYTQPLENTRSLLLLWELPQKFASYNEKKPEELLCWILGHKGQNSLFDELKKQGLALELECGTSHWDGDHILFMLGLELTNKGVEHFEDIVTKIYETFAKIKSEGVPRYIFDDVNAIETLKYQYPERETPYKEVVKHSKKLRFENLESYPEKSTIIKTFDPQLIKELISNLTPQNMILDLLADPALTGIQFDQQEKWMGANYTVKTISPELMNKWSESSAHPTVKIPPPNPYIPKQLSFHKNSEKKVIQNEGGILYLIPDSYYRVPKISWTILIKTPVLDAGNHESVVLADLLIQSVKKELTTSSYEAKLAGLEYDIEQEDSGLKITLNGYSENASRLLSDILDAITNISINEQKFNTYKKALEESYKNFNVKSPYLQALDLIKEVIYERYTSEPQKQKALETINYNRFKQFAKNLFDKTYIKAVFFGNVESKTSQMAWNELLKLSEAVYPLKEQKAKNIAILPEDSGPYYLPKTIKTNGNALMLIIEDPKFSFASLGSQEILAKMMATPFFNELRTKQQTAYIIGNLQQEIEKVLFQLFVLESYTYDPRDLLARTELFIETFAQSSLHKEDMKNQFETIKTSLINKLQAPPESLKEKGKQLALMALSYDGDFDWNLKRIEALKALNYEEFLTYATKFLSKSNKRRLAALMEGNGNSNILQYTEAENVDWVRQNVNYIPAEAP